jgi:nicotinamide-nucleotide amidase
MMRDAVDVIAESLKSSGRTVAVAESLTCGKIASALGAGPEASEWLRGGVVAYADEVKFDVLGVAPGPVITAECAAQMATGVRGLLGADFAVAATGVGGPGPEEGKPAGTVFIAIDRNGQVEVNEYAFAGDPVQVLAATVHQAMEELRQAVTA